MVSTTSASAAWTTSRTCRQTACCQSGSAAMYAPTYRGGSTTVQDRLADVHEQRRALADRTVVEDGLADAPVVDPDADRERRRATGRGARSALGGAAQVARRHTAHVGDRGARAL